MLKAHTCLCPKKFLFICETPCHFHTAGKKLLTLGNCGLKINDQEGVLMNTTMCFIKRTCASKRWIWFLGVYLNIFVSSQNIWSLSLTPALFIHYWMATEINISNSKKKNTALDYQQYPNYRQYNFKIFFTETRCSLFLTPQVPTPRRQRR